MYKWKVYVNGNSILNKRFNRKGDAISYANRLKEQNLSGSIYNLETLKTIQF